MEMKLKKKIHISEEEEQTLYYVIGFIVFSMKRKHKKILRENPKSISASNALIFLKSVNNVGGEKIQEKFFNEFVKKWIGQINRGGLIQTKWVLSKHIELVAKSLMMSQFLCKYRNEDVTDIFKEKLIQ